MDRKLEQCTCSAKSLLYALYMYAIWDHIDEFRMLWLPWATHRKVWHKMAVWTATCAWWLSKRPFCAILFYASPRVTIGCETRLHTVAMSSEQFCKAMQLVGFGRFVSCHITAFFRRSRRFWPLYAVLSRMLVSPPSPTHLLSPVPSLSPSPSTLSICHPSLLRVILPLFHGRKEIHRED